MPEPWLRGTLSDVPAVARGALHALELARQDIARWCEGLTDAEMNAEPLGLPPLVFHIRHLGRSVDRLLTYAEGQRLNVVQIAALNTEHTPNVPRAVVMAELAMSLTEAEQRVRALASGDLDGPRSVGTQQLPSTLGGLLVHIADHTQRHVGEIVTTAKLLLALRKKSELQS